MSDALLSTPATAQGNASRQLRPLRLPQMLLHPWILVSLWVVPQAVLLWLNYQVWDLASGEMSASQKFDALQIFGTQLSLFLVGVGLSAWLYVSGQTFSRLHGLVAVGLSAVFLATVFLLSQSVIPLALRDWMLPRDQWLIKQFALVMPIALFGSVRLVCPNLDPQANGRFWQAAAQMIGLIIASVAFLFTTFQAIDSSGFGRHDVIRIGCVAIFIAISTLAAGALLRVLITFYLWARANSRVGMVILGSVIAIIGPLGGLYLNQSIAFPVSFQIPSIYILAALNGGLLLLPTFAHPGLHRAVWLAQCALFPFTVYFFAVFLPFLPLGPLAILAAGMGFFLYVPTGLFILHSYRLIDGFRAEIRDGSRWVPALMGITAIACGPVIYTVQAQWDRAALHQALDYLRYPDYSKSGRYSANPSALRSSLVHLQEFKQGAYLPYLSEYYNWLAFDNLVLPQAKIDSLATTFFGEPLPKPKAETRFEFLNLGRSRPQNVTEVLGGQSGIRPSQFATLKPIQATTSVNAGIARTKAALTIENPTDSTTEFRTQIQVPPGVMITGMTLTIGDEVVPGRLFEQKSALWVYQKITEVRPVPQDPAILRYIGPQLVELRVYPVEPKVPRFAEVEFMYPANFDPQIRIGEQSVAVPKSLSPTASLAVAAEGSFAVTLPAETAAKAPAFFRRPDLHLLVDASANSIYQDPAKLRTAIERVEKAFPESRQARVRFVNYETHLFKRGESLPFETLRSLPDHRLIPESLKFRGSALVNRAVKEILWQHHQSLRNPDLHALIHFPKIVWLAGTDEAPKADDTGGLADFAKLLPDQLGYWTLGHPNDDPPAFQKFDSNIPQTQTAPQKVRIFRLGDQRFVAPGSGSVAYQSLNAQALSPNRLEAFDPTTEQFISIGEKPHLETSTEYQQSLRAWDLELRRIFEPFRHTENELAQLVELSREAGVLVKSTAYMVVENSAQWKMLVRSEKKALKGHESLAMAEPAVTPEPGTSGLLILAFAALAGFRYWKKRQTLALNDSQTR